MVIDFLPVRNGGAHVFHEVARVIQQPNCGSFVICSVATGDFETKPDIKGTINGATIKLTADGKSLPYRLQIGNKSINQLRLWQLGYHIPDTVVLDFSISDAYKREATLDLHDLYEQMIASPLGTLVAVRCSSNLEDGDAQSFAGTFDTYLDVPNQLDAIKGKIIESYRKFCLKTDSQSKTLQYDVRLSIMIQQMIRPKLSGILFTMDPMNPPSDWIKIEYWQGPRGNSEGASITLNRKSGKRVRSDRDGNKTPLSIAIQEKLYDASVRLERHFGTPQDIEFLISDEDELYLVQSRPITAFGYSPDKVRVNEQQKLSAILEENQRLYHLEPVLSSTNISELFTRAIPLSYSIFKYGFAGTSDAEGGISIGRSRLGYARLNPTDATKLFYTVADQARTNIIVDALTFRLPGISKQEYLKIFVRYYLEQIRLAPTRANYPEDGLYVQTDDPARWLEVTSPRAEHFRTIFVKFLEKITNEHAPKEYINAGIFFRQNDRRYHSYLDYELHNTSPENLRQAIKDILSYLRTRFCPQYAVYARLAFLCTHLAKMRLSKLLDPQNYPTAEQILNELLRRTTIPTELKEPQYAEFERLFKLGRVPLPEFLHRFQHLGSLDITQLRLGEYSLEKLYAIFGSDHAYGFDGELAASDEPELTNIDIERLGFERDPEFELLYTYGGQFMRLREKAKSELLKLLWVLKRMFVELARLHRFGDLIYYLNLDEALNLSPEKHDELRMLALQRKAYLEACRQHRVKDVLLDLLATPFEKKTLFDEQENASRFRFARGKTIFYGHAEGFCITASSNEEFFNKLAACRAKNIENIVGVFKGIEPSYLNMSALVGFTTEHGGYLSHAATIAREFRLPYVTGIGFDQFRDEDYVIIDAENNQVIIRR